MTNEECMLHTLHIYHPVLAPDPEQLVALYRRLPVCPPCPLARQLIKIHRSQVTTAERGMPWPFFFLLHFRSMGAGSRAGGAAGKELYGDVEGGRSGAEGHLGRCAPVSGFINRSLSLLSAGIPFQFLSHLKIQQGWKRKDKIWVLCS